MKKLLLIATGGTIASKPTASGLAPQLTSEELLLFVPELEGLGQISAVQLYNLDSTDMTYAHWMGLAACIRERYAEFDGFVVTHGTDTMAYAVAVLSYLIQNSPKPIVFTGSQRSIYLRDTDARDNLLDAVRYACDEAAHGVVLAFDGRVIAGTRAKKTRTKSFNAFTSIDYPEIAVITGGRVRRYIEEPIQPPVRFYDRLDTRVHVLKLIPGIRAEVLDYIEGRCRALVIESFGLGGIPAGENGEFVLRLERLMAGGLRVIVTTQVLNEGSDMEVYSVGRSIKERLALLEAYDMTVETVVAKTMWALALTDDEAEFRRLFQTPVAHDIL